MSDQTIGKAPLNLLDFVARETHQFLVSLANNEDQLKIHRRLQGLYEAALSNMTADENDIVVFQLLTFTHYHFLFSNACLMRCHLSEAFASARAAIDAALIAAHIIHDRASQVAYTERQKPFDKLNRHLGNLIRNGKELPHPLVPALLELHGKISAFAHADVHSFVHRVRIVRQPETVLTVEYFQFANDETERKIHALNLFHVFVMVLDVFSEFLVREQKVVPQQWQDVLHGLGQAIECQHAALRRTVYPDEPEATNNTEL